MAHDLSPWSMFLAADIVVQGVMVGLAVASLMVWTVLVAKWLELRAARAGLRRALALLGAARALDALSPRVDIAAIAAAFVEAARTELSLSDQNGSDSVKEGIKERVGSHLERLAAAEARRIGQGLGIVATIGATAPFVGLFGTVWGIMNSFVGIAASNTTNLAVVAPGIAEALLATACGLGAAIPAVVIYNHFTRAIGAYRAQVVDAAAAVLRLVSRDLDSGRASRAFGLLAAE